MKRLLFVVILITLAGCLGPHGGGTPTVDTETPIPSLSSASSNDGEPLAFEYVIKRGSMADSVAHVYVDFAVYLAEHSEDVYACTDGAPLFDNKYDPTPTPLPTPAGQCKRIDGPRVDVASINDTQSLGEFRVNRTYSGGHTLVVHDVTIILENGTTARDVHDTDFRAVTERTKPSGVHGVTFTVIDYGASNESVRWRFGGGTERFTPSTDSN